MTAWLDYLDARRRMVHEWREQGVAGADIAVRLEVDAEHVERILEQLVDPPLPGCSRDIAARLKRRVADLERELHRVMAPPSGRPPSESEFRALALHPEPELCGCQYWHDTAIAGQHNPRCEHANSRE